MIPDIGIMVGCYILMRVAEVLFPREQGMERPTVPVLVLAVLTAAVAALAIVDLALRGSGATVLLPTR